MNKLIEIIKNTEFEEDKLYLLEDFNGKFGFFFYNGEIIFGKRSSAESVGSSISTDYLDMELNVFIRSLNSKNVYETGDYDLLVFKDIRDEMKADIFYSICSTYANDQSDITFSDFFNSLVDIFRENLELDFDRSLGLFGEMLLIKKAYEECGLDISSNWHRNGINSKFDFSFSCCNIEAKTTCKSEMEFNIKHSQIFNNQNNFVAIINVLETGEGDSIFSLYNYFKSTLPFSNNVKLQICLTKEMSRVRKPDKYKFAIDSLKFVNVNDMKKIDNIPSCISNLNYFYDFSETKKHSIFELNDLINQRF